MKRTKRAARSKQRTKPAPKRRAAAVPTAAAGAADVRAYLAKLPAGQRAIARRFDALLAREVADLRRCIKWGMPFYGVAGCGWFVSCGGFPDGVKVTFFEGTKLKPVPPVGTKRTRGLDARTLAELDAAPLKAWIRQAAALPGFGA